MSFRNPRPPRRKSSYRGCKNSRRQSSFLASLGKIGIPAALIGTFGALLLNWDARADSIFASIQNLLSRTINAEAPFEQNNSSQPENAATASLSSVDIRCRNPRVTDGDTLRCGDTRIRLEGIDTPEMAGHCREGRACTPGDPVAAKNNLQRLDHKGELQCEQTDTDHYGRAVARCTVANVDLSCEQVRSGHAVFRYSRINC